MEFHVSLVGRNGVTDEIYQQIRNAIVDGPLRPGDRLPPSRELARRLSVSRTTVVVAYDRLNGEGFVTSRTGDGTFIIGDLRERERHHPRTTNALRPRPVWNRIPLATAFTQRAEYDFRTGLPDTARVPVPDVAPPDRRRATGVRGRWWTVRLAPGDHVAVEDPGYEPARLLFESLGLIVSGVPVDSQGLVVDALPPTARLVYVTPSHQYPLGMSMSLPRRVALLAWPGTTTPPSSKTTTTASSASAAAPSSRSKPSTPAVESSMSARSPRRCSPHFGSDSWWHPPLRKAIHAAKYVTDWHTPLPTQVALARFIDEGGLGRHIRTMRTVYQERHDRIVTILDGDLSDHLTVVPSTAGLHISAKATRASPTDLTAVLERAQGLGVAFHRLSVFGFDQPARAGVTLGYGAIAASDIEGGLHRLRLCLDAVER